MRVNLVTPFAEKDAVKALGARWDANIRVWYIVDVPDLTPFMRWIPNLDAAAVKAADTAMQKPSQKAFKVPVDQFKGPTTKSVVDVPHCGCNVLPWDDCEHTATA